MNTRLTNYLRSIGLAQNASDDDAWTFFSNLRGVQRSVANNLNYNEADDRARTNCDLLIRSLGFEPDNPNEPLPREDDTIRASEIDGALVVSTIEGRTAVESQDIEAARTAGAESERARQTEIRELAEPYHATDEMVRTAIDDGSTLENVRTEFLRSYRETQRTDDVQTDGAVPGNHSSGPRNDQRDALTAAFMMRHGISDPTRSWPTTNEHDGSVRLTDRHEDARLQTIAEDGYRLRGYSMIEIVRQCLAVDGIRCEPTVQSIGHAIQQAAYTRGGTASGTLAGVMTNTFAAALVSSYVEAPDSTEGWVNEADVPNYLTNERTRIENAESLAKRGSGGAAEMGELGDQVETYKVAEYARQLVIDEQDLINDRFSALEENSPRSLGQAAARLRPDLVYAILLANANMRDAVALFHATHANLNTTAALSVATLEAARAGIRKQQGERSENLNLNGQYLIVPAELESTGDTLVESNVVVTGSDIVRGALNSNSRAGLRVRADARLDNGVTDPNTGTVYAGSASTWFLSAPGDGKTIEVGYVRQLGRNPRVRVSVLTEGRFGLAVDVQHSVGAKAIDWRGMSKSTA